MKAYPLELRERVVAAVEQDGLSVNEVVELFHVGATFVQKMLRWSRQGESLAPRHGGGAQPCLQPMHLHHLQAEVAAHPDATLEELQTVLCQCTPPCMVSLATVCRALQQLNLPRKKKSVVAQERSKKNARPFVKKSPR